jgi:hypothetical protein
MPESHIDCIDSENQVVSRHTYGALDDLEALELAKQHCRQYEVEAWEGTLIVARLTKDGDASAHKISSGPADWFWKVRRPG